MYGGACTVDVCFRSAARGLRVPPRGGFGRLGENVDRGQSRCAGMINNGA